MVPSSLQSWRWLASSPDWHSVISWLPTGPSVNPPPTPARSPRSPPNSRIAAMIRTVPSPPPPSASPPPLMRRPRTSRTRPGSRSTSRRKVIRQVSPRVSLLGRRAASPPEIASGVPTPTGEVLPGHGTREPMPIRSGPMTTTAPMRPDAGAHAGRRLQRVLHRLAADPYLLYTATLVPVVLAVAFAARRPGEVAIAIVLSAAAVAIQALLIHGLPRPVRRRARLRSLVRLSIPLAYVGLAVQLVGGPALPLLALFAPIVAGAAAIGRFQGWATAAVAAAIALLPEVGNLGSPAAVALRGMTLAGVALVLAFGTRRIVLALEGAVRQARLAVAAERRRARQIEALEAVGRLLATGGPSAELIDQVTSLVATRFGYPLVSVYLGNEDRVDLTAQHGYVEALAAFEAGEGVAGRVMHTRPLAFVPDVASDPDYLPGTLQATSLICAPLLVDDRFLGLFNVETSGERRLDSTDRSLIAIVATRIATAVALGRDRQALAARADLFRDIDRFGHDVSGSLAIGPLAEVIATAVGRVVPADTE